MRIFKIIKLINKPLKYKNLRIFERYMTAENQTHE